jgi:hypothetical protein
MIVHLLKLKIEVRQHYNIAWATRIRNGGVPGEPKVLAG